MPIGNTFHSADGQPAAAVEGVTLSIYRDEREGAPLWQETQNVRVDSEGRYSVLLGATLNEGLPLELFTSGEPRAGSACGSTVQEKRSNRARC